MRKGLIALGAVLACVGSLEVPAAIVGVDRPAPTFAIDIGRSITGLVTGIMGLCGDGESKAQLIATQEENNQNAAGGGGDSSSTNTTNTLDSTVDSSSSKGTAGASEFTGSAFDYVQAYVLAKNGNVGYEPLKKVLSSDVKRDQVRAAVLKEFFADTTDADQITTTYQTDIRLKRNEYVQEAAKRHVTLGYKVKGYIQNDLTAIAAAPLSGDGELGGIAVDSHTLEQMVKMELVDLALQIENMEAEAIQFMMNQPVILLSEQKPSGK